MTIACKPARVSGAQVSLGRFGALAPIGKTSGASSVGEGRALSPSMSDLLSDDARLAADIDRLKAEFPKTRELYREVCALLFFRFGVAPTANRLYNLVRRGTMSTPASVLSEFWAELREKSRVRIEHPDLPTDLSEAAGELIGALWTRAAASAHAELTLLRDEVEAAHAEAEQKVVAAREELGRTETALEQRTAALLAAQVEIRELERQQAVEVARRKAVEAETKRLNEDALARERELEKVRDTFSRDLEKLRETAQRAEERVRATEKRALLEIDHERRAAAKAQKEVAGAAKRAEQRDAEHRRTVEARATAGRCPPSGGRMARASSPRLRRPTRRCKNR